MNLIKQEYIDEEFEDREDNVMMECDEEESAGEEHFDVEQEQEREKINGKSLIKDEVKEEQDGVYNLIRAGVSRISLPNSSVIADRYNLSDRAFAAIASGVLVDVGLINDDNKELVIDRSKVRRERLATRKANSTIHNLCCGEALFFDGKIDKTLTFRNNKTVMVKEDHIVLVREPDSEYIGHITPETGSAADTMQAILNFFNSDLSTLLAVGSDGTNVNTGIHGGILRLLELEIKRPVQWLICLLHFNELPLRSYFKFLDGGTSGPKNYEGPIGKAIINCHTIPVAKFVKINSAFSNGMF